MNKQEQFLKLNKTFKINPLYEMDGYKVGHPMMIAEGTTKEYFTLIPRSIKYMPNGIKKIMSSHQQFMVRYLHSTFQENFFDQPIEVAHRFTKDMSKYLMQDYNFNGFEKLHNLGYLPIKIKSLPEGIFTNPNIPHLTGVTTHDDFAWLGLVLETYISKLFWQGPTSSTIAFEFFKNAYEWTKKTDEETLWLTDYMSHDFHSRGGNPFTSISVGLGHAMSNLGSDTLNVIPAARYYYDVPDDDVCINSVNASEHSVTCTGIFKNLRLLREGKLNHEIVWYYSFDLTCEGSLENPDYLTIAECLNLKEWILKHKTGILSVVGDTFNLWKFIKHILPRLKDLILSRDGKLVVRPDSGNPVRILCGYKTMSYNELYNYYNEEVCVDDVLLDDNGKYYEPYFNTYPDGSLISIEKEDESKVYSEYEVKGVIRLLYEEFGGEINKQGYIKLDSHIGAIYGDSINLNRQVKIYHDLEKNGYASTNVILGVGSYTYVMLTRDSAGYAIKGAWFECDGIDYNIYKDPITDDGTKKSLSGLQMVYEENGEYYVKSNCTKEEEELGLLQLIYENGCFYNQTTLQEIRNRLKSNL